MSNDVNHELYQCALDEYEIKLDKPVQQSGSMLPRKPRRSEGDPLVDTARDACLDDNGCWNWRWGGTNNDYPEVNVPQKGTLSAVHRLLKLKKEGKRSRDAVDVCGQTLVAHHTCENRRCVNPEHIEWETTGVNTSAGDAAARRDHHRNRLKDNEADVLSMAERHCTWEAIAKQYGVNASSVGAFLKRRK